MCDHRCRGQATVILMESKFLQRFLNMLCGILKLHLQVMNRQLEAVESAEGGHQSYAHLVMIARSSFGGLTSCVYTIRDYKTFEGELRIHTLQ